MKAESARQLQALNAQREEDIAEQRKQIDRYKIQCQEAQHRQQCYEVNRERAPRRERGSGGCCTATLGKGARSPGTTCGRTRPCQYHG